MQNCYGGARFAMGQNAMKKIIIKEPFYGAGSPKQYGWVKDGYDIKGVGVKVDDVKANKDLVIGYEGNEYLISCEKIKEFVRHYQSFFKVKNSSVVLAVISVTLLDNLLLDFSGEK